MVIDTESFALDLAILKLDMEESLMGKYVKYRLCVLCFLDLLNQGLLEKSECLKLEKKACEFLGIKSYSIIRINNLIYPLDNANMCDEKE